VDEIELPTGEPSTALDDERLRFFLEHQDQIRIWAALAAEVQDAVGGLLRELRVDLIADPRVDQLGIRVGSRVSGETPTGPVIYRPTWCKDDEAVPDVGIAMGWDGRVDPAGVWPKTNLPYVGVLCSHQTNAGRAIETRLRMETASRLDEEPKFRNGSHWVVYRPIKSSKDWWRDIAKWRAGLLDELLASWTRWSAVVDEAVSPED